MPAYRKGFDENKFMSFFIKGDQKSIIKFDKKVKYRLKKEFDSEPVYNKKYLKAKIKSYNGKINTNFHNNKIPKEDSKFIFLSVILIDSVFRASKNYYPQILLEECKYVVKEKRFLSILLTIYKFLLILIEKILMKKTKKY